MLKELFRHSVIYGIASVLQNATGFFLLPLYTAYLSVNEYGNLEIFIVTTTVLVRVLQLGFGSALFKYFSYTKPTQNEKYNKILISTSFYFLIIFGFITLFILYFFQKDISNLLFNTPDFEPLIGVVLFTVFFQLFFVIPMAYLRIQNKSVMLSALNFLLFLIQIILIIFFVVKLNKKIDGILLAKLITSTIFAIIFVGVVRKNLILNFSKSILKEMLSYGVYLVPVSVGGLLLMMANRYFILLYKDSTQLGLYSVANRIASIILLAVSGFQMAWPSIMFRIKEMNDAQNYYSRIFVYFVLVFVFLIVVLSLFSREFILILANDKYLSIIPLIPIIATGYFFYGIFYAGSVGINIFKKTYFQTIATIIAAAINLILNFILTPTYGIWGTSMAHLFSFAILGILAMYFSQRIYFIKIEWDRIIKILFVIALIILVNFILVINLHLWGILFKIILLFSYPILLYYFNFFKTEEKKFFKEQFIAIKQIF